MLIDFLNSILQKEIGLIKDIKYSPNEHQGLSDIDRRVIFDIYCITDTGERVIVEMQRGFQVNYADRSLYYSTFPIHEQGIKGPWDYELKAVYTISLLNFEMKNLNFSSTHYLHFVKLTDQRTHEVFSDKLNFVYLELPKFKLKGRELGTKLEKWLYLLKNMEFLERLPKRLQEKIFQKLMKMAEIKNLDTTERIAYKESLKQFRDLENALQSHKEEGREEGREEKAQQIALNLRELGHKPASISKVTGIPIEELHRLFHAHKTD